MIKYKKYKIYLKKNYFFLINYNKLNFILIFNLINYFFHKINS